MAPYNTLRSLFVFLSLFLLLPNCHAFYIPGYSIQSYGDGESIPVLVNKIFSDSSSFQYAYSELPFVCPFGSGEAVSLNLGEILRGDRIVTSDFELGMGKDAECRFLCRVDVGRKDVHRARELVSQSYVAEWIADNLPGATSFVSVDKSQKYYSTGFKIGFEDFSTGEPRYFLNNHFTFVVRWRKAPGRAGDEGKKVIVGFEIYPKSIGNENRLEDGCPKDVLGINGEQAGLELYIAPNKTKLAEQYPGSSYLPVDDWDVDDGATLEIPYSYSVYFRPEEDVEWSNRWDLYFNSQQEGKTTHWLAIINSLIISGILGVGVYVIWGRTVKGDVKERGDVIAEEGLNLRPRKDRSPHPEGQTSNGRPENGEGEKGDDDGSISDEEVEEVAAWKRLHGDIFRIPAYGGLLAPLIGSGMQLLFMVTGLLLLSSLGVLNPSFRGGFISVGLGLFIFAGLFSGYFSARLYKTLGGKNSQNNTLITALLFPGLLFWQIFSLNLFLWARSSSTALPFSTLVALVALWLLIQVPLVYLGSWVGYAKSKPWENPTRTNAIPRQIPHQPWYVKPFQASFIAGFVPFAVLFVELLYLFRSLVQDKSGYYYVFGYLSIVCVILLITVSEVTIIATYIHLNAEHPGWWWRSFFTGGSSALWIFIYCVWYYFAKLNVQGFVSGLLFFSYSLLGCAVYGLLTGTVGFLTAYVFVRRIYSSVKVD